MLAIGEISGNKEPNVDCNDSLAARQGNTPERAYGELEM